MTLLVSRPGEPPRTVTITRNPVRGAALEKSSCGLGMVLGLRENACFITSVASGSPAAMSGRLLPGDVILAVDGVPLQAYDPAHRRGLIGPIGSRVVLKRLRPSARWPAVDVELVRTHPDTWERSDKLAGKKSPIVRTYSTMLEDEAAVKIQAFFRGSCELATAFYIRGFGEYPVHPGQIDQLMVKLTS